jgi:hypothetical protein
MWNGEYAQTNFELSITWYWLIAYLSTIKKLRNKNIS